MRRGVRQLQEWPSRSGNQPGRKPGRLRRAQEAFGRAFYTIPEGVFFNIDREGVHFMASGGGGGGNARAGAGAEVPGPGED